MVLAVYRFSVATNVIVSRHVKAKLSSDRRPWQVAPAEGQETKVHLASSCRGEKCLFNVPNCGECRWTLANASSNVLLDASVKQVLYPEFPNLTRDNRNRRSLTNCHTVDPYCGINCRRACLVRLTRPFCYSTVTRYPSRTRKRKEKKRKEISSNRSFSIHEIRAPPMMFREWTPRSRLLCSVGCDVLHAV